VKSVRPQRKAQRAAARVGAARVGAGDAAPPGAAEMADGPAPPAVAATAATRPLIPPIDTAAAAKAMALSEVRKQRRREEAAAGVGAQMGEEAAAGGGAQTGDSAGSVPVTIHKQSKAGAGAGVGVAGESAENVPMTMSEQSEAAARAAQRKPLEAEAAAAAASAAAEAAVAAEMAVAAEAAEAAEAAAAAGGDAITTALSEAEATVAAALRAALEDGSWDPAERDGVATVVAAAEVKVMRALDDVEAAALEEVSAAQADGFVSADEKRIIDGRLTRVSILLGALLESFKRELSAATAVEEEAAAEAGPGTLASSPTGLALDAQKLLAPSAARLTRRMSAVRGAVAAAVADTAAPLRRVLHRADAAVAAALVGRCRFTVSKPVLKAPMVSALETIIW